MTEYFSTWNWDCMVQYRTYLMRCLGKVISKSFLMLFLTSCTTVRDPPVPWKVGSVSLFFAKEMLSTFFFYSLKDFFSFHIRMRLIIT